MEWLVFGLMATWVVVMSILVVVTQQPFYSALALIAALCGQAGLYLLLNAPVIAFLQILVYAGAIMVLFLFVIMLLGRAPSGLVVSHYLSLGSLTASMALLYLLYWLCQRLPALPWLANTGSFSMLEVGTALFDQHFLSFEALTVVLLAALVASVRLGIRP